MPGNVVSRSLTAAALDGLDVQVTAVRIEESLDRPFVADVRLEIAPGQEVDTASLVGDDATLVLERPGLPPRRLVGSLALAGLAAATYAVMAGDGGASLRSSWRWRPSSSWRPLVAPCPSS
jgi:uncharacterized protein involved in type VI secretion and phage assembly